MEQHLIDKALARLSAAESRVERAMELYNAPSGGRRESMTLGNAERALRKERERVARFAEQALR